MFATSLYPDVLQRGLASRSSLISGEPSFLLALLLGRDCDMDGLVVAVHVPSDGYFGFDVVRPPR